MVSVPGVPCDTMSRPLLGLLAISLAATTGSVSISWEHDWGSDALCACLVIGVVALAASVDTVNGDVDRCADLAHPLIAQAS